MTKLLFRQHIPHSSSSMKEIRGGSAHLVVTSPPYPMIAKWENIFGNMSFDAQHDMLFKTWKEVSRILCEGGIACVNIGDATRTVDGIFRCYPNAARVTMDFHRLGMVSLIPIIWKKISNRPNAFLGSGFLPPNAYVSQDCEYILIFRKGGLRKFPSKDPRREASEYTRIERDLWFSQLWEIPGARGAGETSAFPEEIPRRLIRMFSVVGDLVVDPFEGTGTTGRIANDLCRSYIGFEIIGKGA